MGFSEVIPYLLKILLSNMFCDQIGSYDETNKKPIS